MHHSFFIFIAVDISVRTEREGNKQQKNQAKHERNAVTAYNPAVSVVDLLDHDMVA